MEKIIFMKEIKSWLSNNKVVTMTVISYAVVFMVLTALCLEIRMLNVFLSKKSIAVEIFERMKTNIYEKLFYLISLVMIFYFNQRNPNATKQEETAKH
jgi:hypothetical protein